MSFPGFPAPPTPGPGPQPNTHDLLSATHGDTTPATPGVGSLVISATGIWELLPAGIELDHLVIVAGIPTWSAQAGSGLGDVTGPGSATDNAIARYDGASGKVIQNSLVLIDDAGNLSVTGNTLISGDLTVLGSIVGLDLAASGFVVGPASSTDSALALYDGTTGELIKDSSITSDGSGLSLPGDLTVLGDVVISGSLSVSGTTTLQDLGLTGTVGDLLYASGTDAFGSLAIGGDGEVLTIVSGLPSWDAGGSSAGGPINVVVETVATTTIADADYFVGASGSTTINLPPTPSDGQRHVIKDSLGTASATPVVIDGNGALIDDAATVSLLSNFESITLVFSDALGRWQLT